MSILRGLLGLSTFVAAGALIAQVCLLPGQREALRLADERAALGTQADELRNRIETWRAAGRRASLPPTLAREVADAAQASLSVQRQVVELAEQNRVTLSAFGAVGPPPQISAAAAAFELEGSATYVDAMRFLAAVEGAVPRLAISHLAISPAGGSNAAAIGTQVALRVHVWGFWEAMQR